MMEQKIKACSRVPTLLEASDQFHAIETDLGEIAALTLAVASPSEGDNIDPRAVRALWIAINAVRAHAEAQRMAFDEARQIARPLPSSLP